MNAHTPVPGSAEARPTTVRVKGVPIEISSIPENAVVLVDRFSDFGLAPEQIHPLLLAFQDCKIHLRVNDSGLDTTVQGYGPVLAVAGGAHQLRTLADVRPRGRPIWIDSDKAAKAAVMLKQGRRPNYIRKKTGLSADGVKSVIKRLREESRET